VSVAIRFFHQLIILQDEFYIRHLCEKHVLGPILDVLLRTMPRDNLLCSACLALFEFIKKESIKELIKHLVENHREKIMALSYLELFRTILGQYDQTQGFMTNVDPYFLDGDDEGVRRPTNVGARGLMEHLPVDPVEEDYWNTSDDEDENQLKGIPDHPTTNSGSARSTPKLLVEYTSDSDGDEVADSEMAIVTSAGVEEQGRDDSQGPSESSDTIGSNTVGENSPAAAPPPERVSEKRRREEDEDDEMGKLLNNKRRNSTSSAANGISLASLRRKRNVSGARADAGISAAPKKISISLTSPAKEVTTSTRTEHDDK
jgi:protein phosphatase 4 regulatory subunit 3